MNLYLLLADSSVPDNTLETCLAHLAAVGNRFLVTKPISDSALAEAKLVSQKSRNQVGFAKPGFLGSSSKNQFPARRRRD